MNWYSKFYPERIIQKELYTKKWREKYYPQELSKRCFIQTHMTFPNSCDLSNITLFNST